MSEAITYKGYTIKISQDKDAENTRTEWDNLGTMVCFHRKYQLGDLNHEFSQGDYNSWQKLATAIQKEDIAVILPLYLYDHGGITMSTRNFNCRWDSGQVGFIYITKKKARKEFRIKRITKAWVEKLTTYLKSEVNTYDNYLTGNVYGFQVEDAEENEIVDGSCFGFYGDDHKKSGLIEHAENSIDYEIKNLNSELLEDY
jgi:hypothetical protein